MAKTLTQYRAERLARLARNIADIRARASVAPTLEMGAPPAPETAPAAYSMRVGRKVYSVASLADASRLFCAARDAHGEGASRTPLPIILRNGAEWGHISYNGRVWSHLPNEWSPDDAPVYDPVIEAA
jgi:hypothetical protein